MQISYLLEPELEFGGHGKHVDIRYGLLANGPLDIATESAPKSIRLGLVGTAETTAGVRKWLERCATDGVREKNSRLKNLFPAFPGFRRSIAFDAEIEMTDIATRVIPNSEIEKVKDQTEYAAIADTTDLFYREMSALEEVRRVDVIIVAIPAELMNFQNSDSEDEETHADDSVEKSDIRLDFRRMLKAKGMKLQAPMQIVVPTTYGGRMPKLKANQKKPKTEKPALQDEATRAWNFFCALYYKANGVPWRVTRKSDDLQTCFVGISFYKNFAETALMTSIAQVFNERGEGIIVRGAPVQLTKNDRQPHLSAVDAAALLGSSIRAFRDFHRHSPARVVVHKSSSFAASEIEGFKEALVAERVELRDFVWLDKSQIRLFRDGIYPPLRGTLFELQRNDVLLYTRGSIDFFRTYPGMYVPSPLRLRCELADQPMEHIAAEILALTKLNWNKTQFDGSEPITLHAARQVGNILKYVPETDHIKPRYSFYM